MIGEVKEEAQEGMGYGGAPTCSPAMPNPTKPWLGLPAGIHQAVSPPMWVQSVLKVTFLCLKNIPIFT